MIIVAIMGKSGSGKSTLEKAFEAFGFNRIISYTTRDIRDGEQNHREYHFVSREQFEGLIKSNILAEYAEYNGNFYGAPKPVGYERNVIVVESDGLRKLKQLYGDQVVGVYLDVDDDEIENRLDKRNNTPDRESRKIEDERKFSDIEDLIDIKLNGKAKSSCNIVEVTKIIASRGL